MEKHNIYLSETASLSFTSGDADLVVQVSLFQVVQGDFL